MPARKLVFHNKSSQSTFQIYRSPHPVSWQPTPVADTNLTTVPTLATMLHASDILRSAIVPGSKVVLSFAFWLGGLQLFPSLDILPHVTTPRFQAAKFQFTQSWHSMPIDTRNASPRVVCTRVVGTIQPYIGLPDVKVQTTYVSSNGSLHACDTHKN